MDALVWLVARDDLTIGTLGFLREPFDERSAIGDFALCFSKRLAHFHGQQLPQRILIRHHEIEPFAHDAGAFFTGFGGPAFLGNTRRFDGLGGFRCTHLRHGAKHLTGCGVGHVNGLARFGVHPLAVDVALLFKKAARKGRHSAGSQRIAFKILCCHIGGNNEAQT